MVIFSKGIEGRDVNDVIRLRTRHQKRATVASQYLSCIRGRDDDVDDSDGDFCKVLMMLVMVVMLMMVTQYLRFGVCVQYLNSKVETFAA